MSARRTHCILIALMLTASAVPLIGQTQSAPSALPQPVPANSNAGAASGAAPITQTVPALSGTPTISLATLGFKDGLSFSGLDGRSDLVFRVPTGNWLGGARLVLPYSSVAANGAKRTITILSRENVLAQFNVAENGVIDLPIPLTAFVGDTVAITLRYSGGSARDRCFDARVSADHLRFDGKGGLTLQMVAGVLPSIETVVALLGPSPTIILPPNPTAEQAAAALTIFSARSDSLLGAGGSGSTAGIIRIVSAGDPALRSLGASEIAIGGPDPAAAARAAFGGMTALPNMSVINRLSARQRLPKKVTFADLGVDSSALTVGREHEWTVALPAARIPGGQSIAGMSIDFASLPVLPGTQISAWLNGTMLGATQPGNSGVTHLIVKAPKGMTNSINGLSVRLDHALSNNCDDVPYTMPAQLLRSSYVMLGDPDPLEDFHGFASASTDGVTVVLPGPSAIPVAARAVAALLSANVPIKVSYGKMPESGPALVVSPTAPAGTTPPLDMANGRMILTQKDSGAQFNMPQSREDTVVQLVKNANAPILWIKPAASGAVPATMYLSQGDVAIINPAGTIQALSTRRERLDVATGLPNKSWWDRTEWWVFLGLGLAIAVGLTIWSMLPSIKRRKPGQSA